MTDNQTTPKGPEKTQKKNPPGGIFMPWASGPMFIAWLFLIVGVVFFAIGNGQEGDEGGFVNTVIGVILMVIAVIIGSLRAKREGLKIAKESEDEEKRKLQEKTAYIEQLKSLAKQRDEGTLTQQEFSEKKSKILNIIPQEEVEQKEKLILQREDTPEKKEAKLFVLRMYSREEVNKLTELKDAGILTPEEFERKIRQVRLEYDKGY